MISDPLKGSKTTPWKEA